MERAWSSASGDVVNTGSSWRGQGGATLCGRLGYHRGLWEGAPAVGKKGPTHLWRRRCQSSHVCGEPGICVAMCMDVNRETPRVDVSPFKVWSTPTVRAGNI